MSTGITTKKKRIGIYCDPSAIEEFTRYRVHPVEVLAETVRLYRIHDLHLPYDLESCWVSMWIHNLVFAEDIPELESRTEFKERFIPVIERGFADDAAKSDVAVFFTGQIEVGNGQVPSRCMIPGFGIGPMLIGALDDLHGRNQGFLSRLVSAALGFRPRSLSREEYIRCLAKVVAHEQAHLLGVEHSPDKRSIMYHNFSSRSPFFDFRSCRLLSQKLDPCTPR